MTITGGMITTRVADYGIAMLELQLSTSGRFSVQAALSRVSMEIVAAVAEPWLGIS